MRPVFSRIFLVAGIGPLSIVTGSVPATAKLWKRARGFRPSSVAFSALMISTAEAPSEICDELPAVILPSSLNAGFSLASVSAVVPSRMPSSVVSISVSPSTSTGDRDDLVLEAALGGGLRGALLAQGAERVEVLAGDAVLVGDHVGADALRRQAGLGVAVELLLREREAHALHDRGAHRGAGHDLDAGGDDDVVGAGHHALRGEVHRLLARAALAVDGGGRARSRASRRRARRCGRC